MKIEISVQTHFFQRRLCWMLSSILQQKGNVPEMSVIVAYCKNSGDPLTEAVIDTFIKAGMNIKKHEYPDTSEFQYRGFTRNRALSDTDADWIIFADTDMVYPPDFFETAKSLLETTFNNNPHCLYSQRKSTKLKRTEALIDDTDKWDYPCVIPDVWDIANKLPARLRSNVGAGYFHLVNVNNLNNNFGGFYNKPGKIIDWSWEKRGQKAKSDVHFRKRLGGRPIPLPVQIHLQHRRDSEYGTHIEIQR